MTQQVAPVTEQLDTALAKQVAKNKAMLASVLKTILLCGRQNIALRSHRDDNTTRSDHAVNPGNFQVLLDFRCDAGDSVLTEHFKHVGKNATYNSKTIQNDLIDCVAQWIQSKIIANTQENHFFSVTADEAQDVSKLEQLPLVIRYVDNSGQLQEDFLGFLLCDEGITGQAIADLILSAIQSWGLDMSLCRGQCYDEAGNMAGKTNGAAAIIKCQYPSAMYVHCQSHCLNLAVVSACKVQGIRNMMGTLLEAGMFFNMSPLRQDVLEKKVQELVPEGKKTKLVSLCKTRWVLRLNALEVAVDLLQPVVEALHTIIAKPNVGTETLQKANGLLHSMRIFEFPMSLVAALKVFGYTRGITVSLQSTQMNEGLAHQDVCNVIETLESVRNDVDNYHTQWFQKAVNLGEAVGVEAVAPRRRCGRQQHRDNVEADTPEVFYRRAITIPFLDSIIEHLKSRFTDGQGNFIRGFSVIPSLMRQKGNAWREDFHTFCTMYEQDLPSPHSLDAEMDLWQRKWQDAEILPTTANDTMAHVNRDMFVNIYTALVLLQVVPVTSCECERSVSRLRRLKTYMRSTMGQDRLNGLALMHTHYDTAVNVEEVIKIFTQKHPRRLQLVNILES